MEADEQQKTVVRPQFAGVSCGPGRSSWVRTVNDGLHTATSAGSQITISRNVTFLNANHGISSDPGTVVDGGGNESIADPAGCTGVVCA
jgi:hypothetical protein